MVDLLFLLSSSWCPSPISSLVFVQVWCPTSPQNQLCSGLTDRGWYLPGQHGLHVGTPQHRGGDEDFFWCSTLWLFNIAMENGPFIHDFPIELSIYRGFSMAMFDNQMVDLTTSCQQAYYCFVHWSLYLPSGYVKHSYGKSASIVDLSIEHRDFP